MKSSTPKVLQPLLGRPMLLRSLSAVLALEPREVVIVTGRGADEVRESVGQSEFDGRAVFATQEEQLGTGDAVAAAKGHLTPLIESGEIDSVLVAYGDNPLITSETLSRLVQKRADDSALASILTVIAEDNSGYGRILRSDNGGLLRIVEEKDASDDEKEIAEINTGNYCFDARALFPALARLSPANEQGEYYLTDVAGDMISRGKEVAVVETDDELEAVGIDSRDKLAVVTARLRDRINLRWMQEGVHIFDPHTTWIEPEVELESDVTILPGTMIKGRTTIAAGCVIGPHTLVSDCSIDEGARAEFSVLRDSTIGQGAQLGPYCSLRAGTVVGPGAKIGTFVETKNTSLGENSKIPHLSYFGDAEVGEDVNVGAGSITCNFDGVAKHKTILKDGVFIGSDTMLVAPVTLAEGAVTGAGSVVRQDVPAGDVVVGVPAQHLKSRGESSDPDSDD